MSYLSDDTLLPKCKTKGGGWVRVCSLRDRQQEIRETERGNRYLQNSQVWC